MLAPADTDATITAGRDALALLHRNTSWADWCAVGAALVVGRDRALQIAGVTKPYGKPYVTTFSTWIRQHGFDAINGPVRNTLLVAMDNLDAIEKWRATLDDYGRLRWCHPDSVVRHWRAATKTPGSRAASTAIATPAQTRCHIIWPPRLLANARESLAQALEKYGADVPQLARAALLGALRTADDLRALADYQVKPSELTEHSMRPPSPAMVVMHGRKELHP